jgi:hypothetical protein
LVARFRYFLFSLTAYGARWKRDDIVGCFFDADKGEISFALNGHPLGLAFSDMKPSVFQFVLLITDSFHSLMASFLLVWRHVLLLLGFDTVL